jgi:acyl transferase domain-containing protein/NAD(P)-dependent dehydrogenase (short-subunit alcohol dehydrogenase family)/acyl carrier protein/NRPS condensation-like uncharacterized protein
MSTTNKVAIIGLSGVFPDAKNLSEFFRNLQEGKDSVRRISIERLRHSSVPLTKKYKHMATLDRIDYFDHKFFKISRKDADYMDPVQRMLLQMSCEAIENAGYNLDDFNGSNTAVFLGGKNESGQYYFHLMKGNEDPAVFTGTLGSMAYGRIAYFLNTCGPAMMVDTACSSALVAIDHGCQKIVSGEVDYVLAGALSISILFPLITSRGYLGSHAPDGRCKAFDASADGIGSGEGGAMFLLKRLDKAIADKDNVQAVILGSAVNHDGGRSNGITAPSPEAQAEAIRRAWKKAGVAPESVAYIETHGTGTKLGDPIEFRGITDAFNEFTSARKFCAIGSVKTNIGHLGSGAGAAGLVKAILSMKNRQLLPSINFHQPNPFIDFENSAAYVHTSLQPWESVGPRRCGLSAFGLSGTNAHLVLEEGIAKEVPAAGQGPLLLKIAAANTAVIKEYTHNIHAYLQDEHVSLHDALYTLNAGRKEFPVRKAFYADDKTQLLQQLAAFAEDTAEMLPLKEKNAVLLFSGNEIDYNLATHLCEQNDVFREQCDQVLAYESVLGNNEKLRPFAFYLGLYHQLKEWGVNIKTAIGRGSCKYITQLITGKLDLEAALRAYCAEADDSPVDEAKLKTLVQTLNAKDDVVFIEMGAEGVLSDMLESWKTSQKLPVFRLLDKQFEQQLPQALAALYNAGLGINWKKYYAGRELYRVEAPTYPFEKTRCWFEEPLEEPATDIQSWMHALQWVPASIPASLDGPRNKTLLVFTPAGLEVPGLVEGLGSANKCIQVVLGDHYRQENDQLYYIDCNSYDDFVQLQKHLQRKSGGIHGMVFIGEAGQQKNDRLSQSLEQVNNAFYSLFFCARAFSTQIASRDFMFTLVTFNAFQVNSADLQSSPFRAMSHVFLKGLMAENTGLKVNGIDCCAKEKDIASIISAEMQSDDSLRFVAYRGGRRYVQQFSKIGGLKKDPAYSLQPKEGDVFIISGGASGLGYEAALRLSQQAKCHLIILGRTELPAKEQWVVERMKAGEEGERIRRLVELQRSGATVDYHSVNLADIIAMEEVFEKIRAKHKKIQGVFHAAGIGSSGTPIKKRELKDIAQTFEPKVYGTIHLHEFTAALHPEFFVCFSSIGALVPAANSADYSAANAFQDAFVSTMRRNNHRHFSVNWADWRETGLSYRKAIMESPEEIDAREALIASMPTKYGIDALFNVVESLHPNVAVVEADFASFRVNPFFIMSLDKTAPEPITTAQQPAKPEFEINVGQALSPMETTVARIWTDVLKLDNVKLDDDFYKIGGHSLNLAQMIGRIEKNLGIRMEMKEMLRNNTVRKLSTRLEELQAAGQISDFVSIPALPVRESYEISHTQKRFWMTQFSDAREAYHVPGGYRLTGELDRHSLEKAFLMLINRHESLRTTFHEMNGTIRQIVHTPGETQFSLRYQDISGHPDPESETKRIARQEAAAPFDLSRGPLIRARLLRVEDDVHVFLMTLHHIISDGISMSILRNEVLNFYKSIRQHNSISPEPLRIHYKDFAAWQNEALRDGQMEGLKQYWKQRLAGLSAPVTLPADNNTGGPASKADNVLLQLENDQLDKLRRAEKEINPTLFTMVYTLINILIYRLSKQKDIVLGSPVSGRLHADLQEQIGNYLNTILLRTVIEENDSYVSLLSKAREQVTMDFENQMYPLDILATDLKMKETAPFNIGFTWNTRGTVEEEQGTGLVIEDYYTGFKRAKTDLWFFGIEWEEGLNIEILYRTSLFRHETIELMAARFRKLMQQCILFPRKRIKDLDLELDVEKAMKEQAVSFSLDL